MREQARAAQRNKARTARKAATASGTKKPTTPIVRVKYLNDRDASASFAYYWRADSPARVGLRVLAPVRSGYWEEAVIVGFGRAGYVGRLKSITRVAR